MNWGQLLSSLNDMPPGFMTQEVKIDLDGECHNITVNFLHYWTTGVANLKLSSDEIIEYTGPCKDEDCPGSVISDDCSHCGQGWKTCQYCDEIGKFREAFGETLCENCFSNRACQDID